MAIEVRIEKRYVFIIIAIALLIAGLFIATAYGTSNPPVFGHTPSELGAGAFTGTASDVWRFPGVVAVGNSQTASENFYVQANASRDALIVSNGNYPTSSPAAVFFPTQKFLGVWTDNPRVETHIQQSGPNALRLSSGNAANANSALQLYNNDGSSGYWGWSVLELGSSGDFQINYDISENAGTARLILKRDGTVQFPSLNGPGSAQLCIRADGTLYRGTPGC